MELSTPIGSEIAASLLAMLAAVLVIVARKVVGGGGEPAAPLPSDQTQVDLGPVIERVEGLSKQVRRELDALGQQAATRLEQHDRHVGQLVQSLDANLTRQHREKEIEDRRQFERLQDKIDRMRDARDPGR